MQEKPYKLYGQMSIMQLVKELHEMLLRPQTRYRESQRIQAELAARGWGLVECDEPERYGWRWAITPSDETTSEGCMHISMSSPKEQAIAWE